MRRMVRPNLCCARLFVLSLLSIGCCLPLAAQVQSSAGLTLEEAVQDALRDYPSIHASQETLNAAVAHIHLAQTAYLPHVDGLAQINRATRNTFYGMLLPNAIIPSLDGSPVNNLGSVWDSGAGLLVSWQPFDLGLRKANVDIARAEKDYAQASLNLTRFEVAVATADAFLTVIAAEQTQRAAQAAVDSWEVLLHNIHAVVHAQLRPAADESRVQSELAAARTQLFQAQQAFEIARASLSQFIGLPPAQIGLNPGKLLNQLPGENFAPTFQVESNPLVMQQHAQILQAEAQMKALQRTYRPQFLLQASASGRGTGLNTSDGSRLGGWNGLAPTTQNYGIGFTVTFPFMDVAAVRAQESAQLATLHAQQQQYRLVTRKLQADWDAARAALNGARRVAQNTPIEVSSAQTALNQATAQYKAGLTSIDNLAQAQRLLVQAQIDDALARLNVWRAVLQMETVEGDIQPFISEVSK